ncbi:tannase/feruloyl esterase family alpha/beta hydrolase [Ramlibacter solisilvae]|uniref:Esterase n=1 Tax=Ramlibacter tataouinensis TaxID=94132 RepID=A0A127JVY3_9BURK|nr:tannase/feruloyl esterase family alpha/beta hydrolase [Ramlibacter tataouinensis]AMO24039.1 esterase [Ramlibacter tataouinensis]
MSSIVRTFPHTVLAASVLAMLAACGDSDSVAESLPQLSAATPAPLVGNCADLASRIALAGTTITAASAVAAGTLTIAGTPVPAHCQVAGTLQPRVSPIDGKPYAIRFEMRLPLAWNGRFFHQANGGIDGNVVAATGGIGGGGPLTNALQQGFAVISSDAGHTAAQNPTFGIDPQARLDYGYQAVGKLTPVAKSIIQTAYGKPPDRSYIGGCSNGGRHTMVAAARYADQYDGYLVGDPGFRLPLAAIANMAGAQAYQKLATNPAEISTGFTQAERQLVSNRVLVRCDALDGATDGLVQDTQACQLAFDLARDVPTCTGARDGSCLTAQQKLSIGQLFTGATTSTGARIYSSFPYDAGLGTAGWAVWKFTFSLQLDPGAVGFIWQVPPEDPASFNPQQFALTGSIDSMVTKVNATNATYTENSLSFMTPPNPNNLSALRNRGAKMMAYHGTSDPIFSSDDTTNWFQGLTGNSGSSNFARLFLVPGMNHCSAGPATDQFDMLTPLVNWVERGQAPGSVVASARGAGNAGGVNADVPAPWAANRTRPLCPYPQVARYKGSGSLEEAASFSCVAPG